MLDCSLFRCRYSPGAARTAIEARVANRRVGDDCSVDIRVSHHGLVYPDNRGVVCEVSAAPFAANESHTAVTEPVIHSAVESHVRSPIAGMKCIHAPGVAPVARSPQKT